MPANRWNLYVTLVSTTTGFLSSAFLAFKESLCVLNEDSAGVACDLTGLGPVSMDDGGALIAAQLGCDTSQPGREINRVEFSVLDLTMLDRSSIMEVSMNRLSRNKRVEIVRALVEGCSVRSTCRITGVAKGTVLKLLVDLGRVCADFHYETVHDIECKRAQCDELWTFCYAKAKTVINRDDLADRDGIGDVWTWTGMDADSKLMISWLVADKGPESAQEFMLDLAARVRSRMQLTTDGYRNYLVAVPGAFGREVDYGMLKKIYGDPKPNGRMGTTRRVCIGIIKKRIIGNPAKKHISTSYVERQNLTIRMCSRRYTRLTNAFSKKLENLCAAVALHFVWYNFCRVHQTIKQTPAMASGLADHQWPIGELIQLLEHDERVAIDDGELKRGPYGPRNGLSN